MKPEQTEACPLPDGLNLPGWDAATTPLRPVMPASWEAVMAHFAPLIREVTARPEFEAERLRTKVSVPFVWVE